jgi:four helix bundle protein
MKFDLEERLIEFAVLITELVELLPDNRACNHLAGQLVRSGTAPALIYGEAQSAESRKDFIHKMKLILKELRETRICMKILHKRNFIKGETKLHKGLTESNELISIFVKSVETAQKNLSSKISV